MTAVAEADLSQIEYPQGETAFLKNWRRVSALPGGKRVFSAVFSRFAPYFKTIGAQIDEIEPNFAKLTLKKRKAVENHIGTVHVIAICNLLEMAMGSVAEASIPRGLRWIPKGMSLDYTAKADSDITGIAEVNPEDWKPGDLNVKVKGITQSGKVAVQGVIKLWISEIPKKV